VKPCLRCGLNGCGILPRDGTSPTRCRAQRLPPAPHGVDLILPPSELALIGRIIEHVSYRGRVLDDWGFRRLLTRGQG